MALPHRPRLRAVPDRLHRGMATVPKRAGGQLAVGLAPGVPVGFSCFLLPHLCHLELSGMLLVSQGSTICTAASAVPPLTQHPGPQALSAALARGSFWGTLWFLLQTPRPASVSTLAHRRVAGKAVGARRGLKEDL